MNKTHPGFRLLAVLLLVLAHLSCTDNPASTEDIGSVKISVKKVSQPTAQAASHILSTATGVTITSARVVIKKIKFESIIDDTLDFKFREPFVQELMTGATLTVIETVQVPFGSYKKSKIKIDDLDPEDGQVYVDNPELQDRSVVVKGYVNNDLAETFVFSFEFDEEQEKVFDPPLVLDASSPTTNIVLEVDMSIWFTDAQGNLLDPRVSENKSTIENNIKNSIDIFEDHDDDGERDDDNESAD